MVEGHEGKRIWLVGCNKDVWSFSVGDSSITSRLESYIELGSFARQLKYRSRTDIVATILEAGTGGSTKTKIMYKAYLSYAQLKEYLSILVENGLLEYEDGQQTYKTTEKGIKFVRLYQHMDDLTGPILQETT